MDRDGLLRSLAAQRTALSTSIVLTPTDSLPFTLDDRGQTAFLHGLYLTDKVRSPAEKVASPVQFGGRDDAARDIVEIYRHLAHTFQAAVGSLRLLSGLHAQTVTLMAVSHIGQTVALLSEEGGGHYSTHAILNRLGLRAVDLPVDRHRLCIDRAAALKTIARHQPDIIFIDRSEGLTYEDFSFIGELEGPIKIFDASQYVVPIMSGRYENPLRWGFDLMMFSLHKNFPGPQKAAIVGQDDGELWSRLSEGLSNFVSSSHAEQIYLAGLALLRTDWLNLYERRLLETARALDLTLASHGLPTVQREIANMPTRPATHHVWVEQASEMHAFEAFESLAAVGIQTNYRKLPYRLGYGLRLGTSHSSVAGIDVQHIDELAAIIAATLTEGPSPGLRARTAALARTAGASAILPTSSW